MARREVFFATNRAWSSTTGTFAAKPEEPMRLWPGTVQVERSSDPEVDGASGVPVVTAGDAPGAVAGLVRAWLDAAAAARALPLLTIHGFQYTMPQSLSRAGNICDWYEDATGLRIVPLAFCWPSQGALTPTDYKLDRANAKIAGPALAALVRTIAQHAAQAPRRPVWLAHSMGGYCTHAAMEALGAETGRLGRVFAQAVLVAADDRTDALTASLWRIADIADYVTIGVYRHDATLAKVSGWIMENGPRLGAAGCDVPPALQDRVVVVDYVQAVDGMKPVPDGGTTWNWVGHQYYRNDRRVRQDLVQILADKRPTAVLGRHEGRPGNPTWPELAGRLYVDGTMPVA